MHTTQFITERSYLKGVSQATIQWYHSSFKAFDGALDSKQALSTGSGPCARRMAAGGDFGYWATLNFHRAEIESGPRVTTKIGLILPLHELRDPTACGRTPLLA